MKAQQCPRYAIIGTWAAYVAGTAILALGGRLVAAAAWAITFPLFIALYVRYFPRLSERLGYGSVADVPAEGPPAVPRRVTLYTAEGCPFCPIVQRRLEALSREWGFRLQVVDLTLFPGAARGRRIAAVPAVDVDGHLYLGNATSRELAERIRGGAPPAAAPEPAAV